MPPATSPTKIWAAGAVVYRHRNGELEFLLAHRPRYDDWSLPKGKLDDGETLRQCAVREVEEETSVSGQLGTELGTISYMTGTAKSKAVRYWLLAAERETFEPNAEVDEIHWLRLPEARERASYRRDETLLSKAAALLQQDTAGTVYLLRHVHAGTKLSSQKRDIRRGISEKGRRQLASAVGQLVRRPITTVRTSRYKRCEQTVAPLIDRLGLVATPAKKLLPDAKYSDVLQLAKHHRGDQVVLCTHGEVIGSTIQRLLDDPSVETQGPRLWEKGSTWELISRNGDIVAARYMPLD